MLASLLPLRLDFWFATLTAVRLSCSDCFKFNIQKFSAFYCTRWNDTQYFMVKYVYAISYTHNINEFKVAGNDFYRKVSRWQNYPSNEEEV